MVRNPKDHNSGDALDPGRNLRGILNFPSLNFQSIAKESGHNLSFNEDVNLCNMSIMVQDDAFNSSGPMELTLAEENDPLTAMEGKKRQRLWGPRAKRPVAMKVLSWNVRGLGRPRTVSRLKNKIRAINPRILFLMETKLNSKRMEKVRLKCGFVNGIDIDVIGSKWGLSLGWKGNELVRLKSYSSFHIVVKVQDAECGEVWRFIRFYRNPEERNRGQSWELLRRLGNDYKLPWWFTWKRGRFLSTNIRESLDRGVASLEWMSLFPYYQLEHLSHSFSDYCPILLDTYGCDHEDKLQFVGQQLQHWSKLKNREQGCSLSDIEKCLQELYGMDPSDEVLKEIMEVQLDLNLEIDKEEIFWEQQAWANWLKHGDRNTSFFHKATVQRFYCNRILELESLSPGDDVRLLDLVDKRISSEMNEELLRPFTEDNIMYAIRSMPPLKAPGVDAFSSIFFQNYWHIVGPKVFRYCLSILKGEIGMEDINKSHIVLISKVEKPKNLAQFRPISLCNVIYKIIAKVLVDCMSPFLEVCVSESQGAFIQGRHISDNVLIAYEILHSLKMKKKGRKGNFTLKLDMSKAYDRVEWDFLAGMMSRLGFHPDWVVLIMRCVCSVSYSVGINGEHGKWFSLSRGLRQGDPLSPYLFLFCAEGFSILLQNAMQEKWLKGASIGRERLLINHLFFADDWTRELVTGILGVRVATNPENYLGLPMMIGRKKKWAFAHFVDRFRKRIKGWSLRYLSTGGKEVFRKSSICSAWDLIIDGLVWQIGNGNSVNIWNDPWLPGHENNRLSVQSINTSWTTVNQLIDFESSTWRKEVIRSLFDEDQARRILSILLGCQSSHDLLVWKFEGSGTYSVKSGRLSVDVACLLCKETPEDSDHLLWNQELQSNQTRLKSPSIPMRKQLWRPLDSGMLKLNFYASFIKESGFSFVAVLATNNEGQFMGACTYPYGDVLDAVVAEARVCERALLFAVELGWTRILLEGDSLTTIKKLNSKEEDRLILRPIINNIRVLRQQFVNVSYFFVLRMLNCVAYTLALEGRRRQIASCWFHEPPDSVRKVMEKDW
ncbi:uncharacterized protein LOC108468690 [Gossypium arboreum]|uniref:uncharacterized protein LOC108468690 n=1 Tax=Gossypium arboreum TaxID=29729 RepID=UPI0022F1726A|nr:uncharacterized protein LOC108468690 [Gossypium arboreum]